MDDQYGAMADFDNPALPRATVDPNETLWNMQDGVNHKFAYIREDGSFVTRTVGDFAYLDKRYRQQVREIETLEEWLKNAVGEHDTDMLQEIADIFGITLEREWSFDVSVTFTGSFTCPADVDPQTVIDNMVFSMDESYYYPEGTEIQNVDYSVDCSDYSEA